MIQPRMSEKGGMMAGCWLGSTKLSHKNKWKGNAYKILRDKKQIFITLKQISACWFDSPWQSINLFNPKKIYC